MEAINAANWVAGGAIDMVPNALNAAGRVSGLTEGSPIPTLADLGIGSQAGYMDPGPARETVQAGGSLVGAALGGVPAAGRNLQKLPGMVAEFLGLGTAAPARVAGQIGGMADGPVTQALINTQNAAEQQGKKSTVTDRVLATLGAENPAKISGRPADADRVLEGQLYPEDIQGMVDRLFPGYGVGITPGQAAMGHARPGAQKIQAREIMRSEALRSRVTDAGKPIRDIYNVQRELPGALVAERLGIPPGKGFTPKVIGDKMNEVGAVFDRHAERLGDIEFGPDRMQFIDDLVEKAAGIPGESRLKAIAERIRKRADGGTISGSDWRAIRTDIITEIDSAKTNNFGEVRNNLEHIREGLTDALEGGLSSVAQEEIKGARQSWALLETVVDRLGNVNRDKSLSASNLYSTMMKSPARKKYMMRNMDSNPLLNELDTLRTMEDRITADTGGSTMMDAVQKGLKKTAADTAKKAGRAAAASQGIGL
jgi:hypothetical protein